MTKAAHIFTLLVVAAIILALITHPAGSAGDMAVGGAVLDNTLSAVSGVGVGGGVNGKVSYGGASTNFGNG
jgi:hypothetical protein